MKRGDIVRRIARDGQPIGPYLIVNRFVGGNSVSVSGVYFTFTGIVPKNTLYAVKIISLPLEREVLRRVLTHRQSAISHYPTQKWIEAYSRFQDGEIDLVSFYDMDSRRCYCTVDTITKKIEMGEPRIRIVINNIVLAYD